MNAMIDVHVRDLRGRSRPPALLLLDHRLERDVLRGLGEREELARCPRSAGSPSAWSTNRQRGGRRMIAANTSSMMRGNASVTRSVRS